MHADAERDYVEYVRARLHRWHRAAYLLCNNADRADDIVASTVTALYRHWRRARHMEYLDAYVHRMLVRCAIDDHRRGWTRVVLTDSVPEQPAPAAASVEDAAELRTALAALSRGQREVLVLRFFCDLSVADTAAALKCSPGTVKSQTSRALNAMRGLLTPVPSSSGEGESR
jgi:RNA polymerase sigma-70 factor (sigma-E family)